MNDVALELSHPCFSLGYIFIQLPDLPLQLLYDIHVVALLKIKLTDPNFVLADSVLILANLISFAAYLTRELIVLLLRLIVLPAKISFTQQFILTLQAQCT